MIYILYSKELHRIKIGYTRDRSTLLSRFYKLATCSPTKIELIKTIEGSRSREKEIHAIFKENRVVNEWFDLTAELASFLELEDSYRYTIERIPTVVKESHGVYMGYYEKANLG